MFSSASKEQSYLENLGPNNLPEMLAFGILAKILRSIFKSPHFLKELVKIFFLILGFSRALFGNHGLPEAKY